MEILKPFINFDEVEDAVLIVDKNCEAYYIEYDGKKYISWRNMYSVSNEDIDANVIEYGYSYYSIIDGKLVLKENILENKDGIISGRVAKVKLLKDILPIRGNGIYKLAIEDIMEITNFKEEKAKNPKKTYF